MLECRSDVVWTQIPHVATGQRRHRILDDGVQACLAELDQIERRSQACGMVRGGLHEPAHCGDGVGSERRGHQVGILARNLLECVHIHRLENAGQNVVGPARHESGDRCLLHCDAVVLHSEERDLVIDTMMKEFGHEIRAHFLAPAAHLLAPVQSK